MRMSAESHNPMPTLAVAGLVNATKAASLLTVFCCPQAYVVCEVPSCAGKCAAPVCTVEVAECGGSMSPRQGIVQDGGLSIHVIMMLAALISQNKLCSAFCPSCCPRILDHNYYYYYISIIYRVKVPNWSGGIHRNR